MNLNIQQDELDFANLNVVYDNIQHDMNVMQIEEPFTFDLNLLNEIINHEQTLDFDFFNSLLNYDLQVNLSDSEITNEPSVNITNVNTQAFTNEQMVDFVICLFVYLLYVKSFFLLFINRQ